MNKDYIFVQKKEKAHLFPNIYVIGKEYTYTIKRILDGVSFGDTLVEIKNGVMHWYASTQGLRESGEKAMELIQENPDFVRQIRKRFERVAPQMNSFTEEIWNTDLKKKTDKQLWVLLEQYLEKYEEIYLWGEPLVLVLDDSLGAYLKEYIHTRVKDKKRINEIYNTLISPREKSFVKREEDEFLKLILKAKQKQISDIDAAIAQHTEKYCWIPYDYGIYLWDEKYFHALFEKMSKQRNIKQLLERGKKYYRELTSKQRALMKELEIDTYHRKLFQAMRDGAYLQDYKKEVFTKSHYHMNTVLEEIASRLDVPKKHFQYYLPQEVKEALIKGKAVSKKELAARYKHSILRWYDDKIEYRSEGRPYLEQYLQPDAGEKTKLDGVIACAGKYVGRVRVVQNASQVSKVHQGDIMVTAMTSPEYVPGMRKAGAIITDHGGVMCHAAIVSRELGVPCVVGTRQATQILKDGDIVEVNANHNSVKIFKQ